MPSTVSPIILLRSRAPTFFISRSLLFLLLLYGLLRTRSTYLEEKKKKERREKKREKKLRSILFGPSLRFSSPRSNDPRRLKRSNDRLFEDRASVGARLWESNEREFGRGYTFFLLFAFHAAQYYKLSSIQSYLQKTRRTHAQEGRRREGGREGVGAWGWRGRRRGELRDER